MVYRNPPVQHLAQRRPGCVLNQFTGAVSLWRDGSVGWCLACTRCACFSLRDQSYRPGSHAPGHGQRAAAVGGRPVAGAGFERALCAGPPLPAVKAGNLPDNVGADIVEPAVQGLVYKVAFARFTVREIFSSKRAEIAQIIETELRPVWRPMASRCAACRSAGFARRVPPGHGQPAGRRAGLEKCATLELKDKRVKETELDANADKVRREVAAEAAAREQVIAAKAQEEP